MTVFREVVVVNCARVHDRLALREFVWPIQRCLGIPSRVVHVSKLTPASIRKADAVVFSGCPLQDFEFEKYLPRLRWLRDVAQPLVGVCAGAQILGQVWGSSLVRMKKPRVGVHSIRLAKKRSFLDGVSSPHPRVFTSFKHPAPIPFICFIGPFCG